MIPELTGDAAELLLRHKGHQLFIGDVERLDIDHPTWELFCDDCNSTVCDLEDPAA